MTNSHNNLSNDGKNKNKAAGKRKHQKRAQLETDSLEPRILLSATWIDPDTGAVMEDATEDADQYTGDDLADMIHGLGGDDSLFGLGGDDSLFGDDGDDRLEGGEGADVLVGGEGSDTVSYENSEQGVNVLLGDTDVHGPFARQESGGHGGEAEGDSYDSIENVIGSAHNDYVFGSQSGGTADLGAGDDTFDNDYNQKVSDTILGGDGNDTAWTGDGQDHLDGGSGDDRLYGESGDDVLIGGEGDDIIDGGSNTEYMVSLNESGAAGQYLIVDEFHGFPADEITFETKFQLTGDNNAPLISYSADGRHNEFLVNTFQDGTVHIGVANTHVVLQSPIDLYDGQFHELSVSWESASGQAKLYIDGELAGEVVVSQGASIADGGTLVFGQEQDSQGGTFDANNALEGRLSDVRIFNSVRSAEQIASDAKGVVLETHNSQLVSRYPFNEGGDVAEDFAGRNDLRLAGGASRVVESSADFDTAVYSGQMSDYEITNNGNGTFTVRDMHGNEGTDSVRNVERFQFSDGNYVVIDGQLLPGDFVAQTGHGDLQVNEGARVVLTASEQSAHTTYKWTQTSGPQVDFDSDSATPDFVTPHDVEVGMVHSTDKVEVFLSSQDGFSGPTKLASGPGGLMYATDAVHGRIVTIDADGHIETVASGLTTPHDLEFDKAGNGYFSEYANNRLMKLAPDGTVSVFAADLQYPHDVAVDHEGNIYVTEYQGNRVVKLDVDGNRTIVAEGLHGPTGLVIDNNGDIYVGNHAGKNYIVKIDGDTHAVSHFAEGQFNAPYDLAIDSNGDLLVTDYNAAKLYKVDASGHATVLAGNGTGGDTLGSHQFSNIDKVMVADNGDIFVSNRQTGEVFKIDPSAAEHYSMEFKVEATHNTFLSDLNTTGESNVYGGLQRDTVYWQADMVVDGEVIGKGIGMHPPSGGVANADWEVPVSGTFKATLGMAEQGGISGNGQSIFRVYINNELRYDSSLITVSNDNFEVAIDVQAGETLRLETDSNGTNNSDHNVWAYARIEQTSVETVAVKVDTVNDAPQVDQGFESQHGITVESESTTTWDVEVSSTAEFEEKYPEWDVQSRPTWGSNQIVEPEIEVRDEIIYMKGTGEIVLQDPPEGDFTVSAKIGAYNNNGSYHVGMRIGENTVSFHPGYNGVALRVEGPNGYWNQDLGFTVANGVLHDLSISVDSDTGVFTLTFTDGENPQHTYTNTWTNPNSVGGEVALIRMNDSEEIGIFSDVKFTVASHTFAEDSLVSLGAHFVDPEGENLTYAWTQTGGPQVTLTDANTSNPQFSASNFANSAELTFEVAVSDGKNVTTQTVTIAVEANSDHLAGGSGDDQLAGNADGSVLIGGDGHDDLMSEGGNDVLVGDHWADSAMRFDGLGDAIVIDTSDMPLVDAFTVSATVKLEAHDGWDVIFEKVGTDGRNDFMLGFIEGKLVVEFMEDDVWEGGADPQKHVIADAADFLGEYHNFAYTYAEGNISVYVDGNLVKTIDGVGEFTNHPGIALIGADTDDYPHPTSDSFEGEIADVQVYSKALNRDEVRMALTGHALSDGLVAHYDFEGDTPLSDKSGNGFDGTAVGNPTVVIHGNADGNDTLRGEQGDDILIGGGGDDTLIGGQGDDLLVGGAGFDQAVFHGSLSDYTLTSNPDGTLTVTHIGSGESDTVYEVEQLHFDNVDIDAQTGLGINVADQAKVEEGATFSLSAQGVSAFGKEVSYQWRQTGGPHVSLDNPDSPNLLVKAPNIVADGTLEFEITISDGENEYTETVSVQVGADNDGLVSEAAGALLDATTWRGGNDEIQFTSQSSAVGDEFIRVDPSKTYELSGWAVSGSDDGENYDENNRQYFGVANYDIDKNFIQPWSVLKHGNAADTELSQPLKPGDTEIHLKDASGWSTSSAWYSRTLAWYDYTDSTGNTYDDYTYTRNYSYGDSYGQGLWDPEGVDVVNNVIKLNKPWSGPEIEADSAIRNSTSGGTYQYSALSYGKVPNELTEFDATMGKNGEAFRAGTAYIKPLILSNYQAGSYGSETPNLVTWRDVQFVELDPVIEEGTVVSLTSGVTDPEGQELTYNWKQIGGPVVALDDSSAAHPTFTSPDNVDGEEVIRFEVEVSDGENTTTEVIEIRVSDNESPVITLKEPVTVTEGEKFRMPIQIRDADNDSLTVQWKQTGGPHAAIDNPSALRPTVTAPEYTNDTTLTFEVVVSDGEYTTTETVTIQLEADNDAPTTDVAGMLLDATTWRGGNDEIQFTSQSSAVGDEFIRVDPNKTYELSGWAMSGSEDGESYDENNRQYFGVANYDIDKNFIQPWSVLKHGNAADTELSQPLKPGDTEIHLKDASGWSTSSAWYSRTLAWYDYTDSTGNTYDDYTYTRNYSYGNTYGEGLWNPDGVDVVNNVIKLNKPWSGPEIEADSAIRNSTSGGTYQYSALSYGKVPNELTEFDATMGKNGEAFRAGTAYIKPLILSNYQAGSYGSETPNLVTWRDVQFVEIDPAIEEGTEVTLTSGVRDPEGQYLNYNWRQVGGPTVELDANTASQPKFVAPNTVGSYDLTFEVDVSDGENTTTETVTIHVGADNDGPVAQSDSGFTTYEDEPISFWPEELLQNDSDVEGASLSIASVQDAQHGSVMLNADGTITFTPEANFSGKAAFTYTVSDGSGGTHSATVEIDVQSVVDGANLRTVDALGLEDSAIELNLSASLVDTDGSESLMVTIAGIPEGARLSAGSDNGDGSYTLTAEQLSGLKLTPPANYSGELALTVSATTTDVNGEATTAWDTLQVSVASVADQANLNIGDSQGDEDTAILLNLSPELVDTDGSESLSILIKGVPEGAELSAGINQGNGSWSLSASEAQSVSMTPPENFNGEIILTVVATTTDLESGETTSVEDSMVVTVDAVNDMPVARAGHDISVTEGTPVQLDAGGSSDVDSDPLSFRWTQVSGPKVELNGSDRANPTFMAPEVTASEDVVFEVAVFDGTVTTTDTVRVRVDNVLNVHIGTAGEDLVLGNSEIDIVETQAGDDIIHTFEGNDVVRAGAGDDYVSAGAGDDLLDGGTGNDQLMGGDGNDRIFAGQGEDWAFGGAGDDILVGGTGNDRLFGDEGADYVSGGEGDDVIEGGQGDDVILGGQGSDSILGNEGQDVLLGGRGDDLVDGGQGTDTYVLTGKRSDYSIARNSDGTFSILDKRGIEGTDIVRNVEVFQFADGALDPSTLLNEFAFETVALGDIPVLLKLSTQNSDIEQDGSSPPRFQIMVNGLPIRVDGQNTFSVQAQDGNSQFFRFSMPAGTNMDSVEIRMANDPSSGHAAKLVVDNINIGGRLNVSGEYEGGLTVDSDLAVSVATGQTGRGALAASGSLTFDLAGLTNQVNQTQAASQLQATPAQNSPRGESSDFGELSNSDVDELAKSFSIQRNTVMADQLEALDALIEEEALRESNRPAISTEALETDDRLGYLQPPSPILSSAHKYEADPASYDLIGNTSGQATASSVATLEAIEQSTDASTMDETKSPTLMDVVWNRVGTIWSLLSGYVRDERNRQ